MDEGTGSLYILPISIPKLLQEVLIPPGISGLLLVRAEWLWDQREPSRKECRASRWKSGRCARKGSR